LFRLHIQEAQPHRAMAQHTLQVTHAAASAEAFLGIQSHDAMTGLPYAFSPGITAKAEPRAQGPYTGDLVKLAACRGNTGGQCVGVVQYQDRGRWKCARKQRPEVQSFELL